MKKLKLIAILIMTCCLGSYSQVNYETFKDNTNKKLEKLINFPSTLYNPETESFDPDSLSITIVEDITKYLQNAGFSHFNIKDFPLIDHVPLSDDNPFEVFVIGYHCGGTAGWIPRSIIVKHTKNKPLIYPMDIECFFYEFHQLKDELYLCIGGVPGSGICRGYSIYAIDFNKNQAEFKPVFGKNDSFQICNSDITFEAEQKMLVIDVEYLPYQSEDSNYENNLLNDGYTCFSVQYNSENLKIEDLTLKSKFDGEKFVKPE